MERITAQYQSIEQQCIRIAEKLLAGTEGDQKGDLTKICAAKQLLDSADMARRLARGEDIPKSYGTSVSSWFNRYAQNVEGPFDERN